MSDLDINYLALPDLIKDLDDVPVWARSGYEHDPRAGIFRQTAATREFLVQARREIEDAENEAAEKLASKRAEHERLRQELDARIMASDLREALADRKEINPKLSRAAARYFESTVTMRVRDGATHVVGADGAAVGLHDAIDEFLRGDAAQPFMRSRPATPVEGNTFTKQLRAISG